VNRIGVKTVLNVSTVDSMGKSVLALVVHIV